MATMGRATFGEALRHHRLAAGLTQEQLAERAAMSVRGLSYLEKGARRPYRDTVRRLAEALALATSERSAFEVLARGRGGADDAEHGLRPPLGAVALAEPFPSQDVAVPQVYISYAQADRATVERLIDDLEGRGLTVWSEDQGLPPGTPNWEQALRDAIRAAPLVLLVVSPHTRLSRYVADELRVAELYRRPVCPVWVAGEEWMECIPLGWGGMQRLDARGAAYATALPRIIAAVQEAAQQAGDSLTQGAVGPALNGAPRNPYKGLHAFGEGDAGDFFGRDALVGELVERVEAYSATGAARFLAVVGSSGSGKSSAVLAGLLPRLRAGALPGSDRWAYLDALTPGAHPLTSLATVLGNALPGGSLPALHADLDASERGLHLLAQRLVRDPTTRVVLVVDQAEELFTLAADEGERQRFVDLLLTAATEQGGPVLVLLTLRADFYDRPLSYVPLGQLVAAQSVAVLPMGVDALRAAIEGPAALPDVGVRFEGDLVGDLLYEVRGQAGALPLLQFTLDQLFERRSGRVLTEAAYHAVGGVRGALARRAEATYLELPSEEDRRMARELFLRLIAPGDAEQGSARRRVSEAELELPVAEQTGHLRAVIQRFVGARLLTTTQSGGLTMLEVSHEALIREWVRLGDWLRAAREDVRAQGRISADAAAWETRGRPTDALYRGTVLTEALAWAERNTASALEAAFLAAAVTEGQRREDTEREQQVRELALARSATRRLRTLVAALASFLLVAAGLAALALANANQAQSNAIQARKERQQAVTARILGLSRQLAAQAVTRMNGQYDLALLLALEAHRTATTVEARDAMMRTLQVTPVGLSAFLRGHTLAVSVLALSHNGKVLASGGADGTIRLWDLAARRPLGPPLTSRSGMVGTMSFSPDGTLLACTTSDGTIRLWDLQRRRPIGAPLQPGPYAALISLAFSPDGTMLAVGSTNNTIRLFALAHRLLRPVALIPAHPYSQNAIGTPGIDSLAWSPSGVILASGSIDGTIELWDTRHPGRHAGAPGHRGFLSGHTGTVFSLAFSPDGTTLASADDDHTVRLWDVARQQPLGRPLRGHTDWVETVAFNSQGAVLASGSLDGTIRLWDVRHRRPLGAPLVSHTGEVFSVVFSPDDARLAAGTSDGTIALWDVRYTQPLAMIRRPYLSYSSGMAISPDSTTLALAGFARKGASGPLQLWDVTHRTIRRSIALARAANDVAISPDGRLLAVTVSGPSGRVQLRDAATLRLLSIGVSTQTWLSTISFSPAGSLLATGADAGTIQFWSVVRRPRVTVKPLGVPLVAAPSTSGIAQIAGIAFSPDGRILASSDGAGALRLWDVAQRRPLGAPLARPIGGLNGIAFSPDGKTVASADNDTTVRLWSVAQRRQGGMPLVGHTDAVGAVAFSPDGSMLASAGYDRTVRLWDVASGQPLGTPLTGFTDIVNNLAFSPDGRTLVASSSNGTVRLWNVDLRTWPARACRIANRNLTDEEWRQYLGDVPYHKTCPSLP